MLVKKTVKQLFKFNKSAIIENSVGSIAPNSKKITIVFLVGSGFNQKIPNASTTCRMGWAHGFEDIGIPYKFMDTVEFKKKIKEIVNPIVWTTGYEVDELRRDQLEVLKKIKTAVAVNPWFKQEKKFYHMNEFVPIDWDINLRKKILAINPAYGFTIAPESTFEYFKGWIDAGIKVVSLPMACDLKNYKPNPQLYPDLDNIKMAFVGGYWDYKAKSFDLYLKPYQDQLVIFGYSPWPYANYRGQIDIDKEASLYAQTRLLPVVNEPHVSVMGIDINERIFKVLGSGGLPLVDATPAYREHFSSDELLIPNSVKEYHELVGEIFTNYSQYDSYRKAGQKAVLERHTYSIRAREFLTHFGFSSEVF